FEVSRQKRFDLSARFFEAVAGGDLEGLVELLAADAVAYTDGGGKARAVLDPISGREAIAHLFTPVRLLESSLMEINGQPGALLRDRAGKPRVVITLDIVDDRVHTVHAISNPDKLAHLLESLGLPPARQGTAAAHEDE